MTAVVTTRHGGVSTGAYGSLNLGGHVGDDPAAVAENRRRLAAALGVDRLTIADQRHTARVAVVDDPLAGRGHDGVADSAAAFPATDAMITACRGRPDDPGGRLRAGRALRPGPAGGGVAHSGRAGTVKGVIPETVKAMAAAFGSDPGDLLIGIGPAIGAASYEIGAAEAAEVTAVFGAAASAAARPDPARARPVRPAAAIRGQLRAAGVPAGTCTTWPSTPGHAPTTSSPTAPPAPAAASPPSRSCGTDQVARRSRR